MCYPYQLTFENVCNLAGIDPLLDVVGYVGHGTVGIIDDGSNGAVHMLYVVCQQCQIEYLWMDEDFDEVMSVVCEGGSCERVWRKLREGVEEEVKGGCGGGSRGRVWRKSRERVEGGCGGSQGRVRSRSKAMLPPAHHQYTCTRIIMVPCQLCLGCHQF